MHIGQSVGKYTLAMKARRHGYEQEVWVFMDGDRAVEWDPKDGIPSEKDMDTHSGGEC